MAPIQGPQHILPKSPVVFETLPPPLLPSEAFMQSLHPMYFQWAGGRLFLSIGGGCQTYGPLLDAALCRPCLDPRYGGCLRYCKEPSHKSGEFIGFTLFPTCNSLGIHCINLRNPSNSPDFLRPRGPATQVDVDVCKFGAAMLYARRMQQSLIVVFGAVHFLGGSQERLKGTPPKNGRVAQCRDIYLQPKTANRTHTHTPLL